MAEPQVFTLESVNALVPELTKRVAAQLERRGEIESRLKLLAESLGEVPDEITPPAPDDSEPVRKLKIELIERIAAYQAGWGQIEALGAILKDPRVGLLDFYGRVDGKLVWLCWKYGEREITHYHALDEGFSNRKPIATSAKIRMLN